MEGHELLGFFFFVIGLWHLFNHIKLHALCSKSYTSTLWFPIRKCRYLELNFIMASCVIFIAMELFIAPVHHQPFDPDGTIPSNHLHNFEHSSMASAFLVYATFAIVLDRKKCIKAQNELTHLLGGIAFSQQLLLIHLHSTDHMGPEGQYHFLLQILVFISLVTTLMGIGFPKSFLVSFSRSVGVMFQGVWLMVMGFLLWNPGYEAKGCFHDVEEGPYVIECSDDEALHRAVSLVNIQFSFLLVGVTVFATCFFLILATCYGEKVKYVSLRKEEHYREEDGSNVNIDVGSQYQKESTQEQI